MHKLTKVDLIHADKIIENSDLHKIDVLYLHGNLEMDLSKADHFLPSLLKVTTKQIFIDSFYLNELDLKVLFSNSNKVKELVLINCQIGAMKGLFELPNFLEFKMEKLDLFWTAIRMDRYYMDEKKLNVLFDEIRKSKLAQSLKYIHACEEDFNHNDLDDLVKAYELDAETIVDNNQPWPER